MECICERKMYKEDFYKYTTECQEMFVHLTKVFKGFFACFSRNVWNI